MKTNQNSKTLVCPGGVFNLTKEQADNLVKRKLIHRPRGGAGYRPKPSAPLQQLHAALEELGLTNDGTRIKVERYDDHSTDFLWEVWSGGECIASGVEDDEPTARAKAAAAGCRFLGYKVMMAAEGDRTVTNKAILNLVCAIVKEFPKHAVHEVQNACLVALGEE